MTFIGKFVEILESAKSQVLCEFRAESVPKDLP